MQLLQFAEPIEKSRVIYFDRRPESSRPVNQTNQFPKTLYDKNDYNTFYQYGTVAKKNKSTNKTKVNSL